MSRRAGMTLIELIVALTLFLIVLGLVSGIGFRFETSTRHLAEAMADLRTAERFTADVKRDLARASRLAVEPGRLSVDDVVYAFAAEEGTVTRTSPEPTREYPWAFDAVTFGIDGKAVSVTVELRKHDPESPLRPRWRSVVLCEGVKP